MKQYYILDENDYLLAINSYSDNYGSVPGNAVDVPLPEGFHKYKFDRATNTWVEGMTDEEYAAQQAAEAKQAQIADLMKQIAALDNPRDAESVYIAISTNTALDEHTATRFAQKQALREQLAALNM